MSQIHNLDAGKFEEQITHAKGKVVLDIWGSGCAPCVVVGNILVDLAEELPELTIFKMNFADGPEIAVELGVMGLPSLFLFEDGELKKQHAGAITKADLRAWITA
ncbi:hypothetical protein BVY04_04895 [bacterium M21]|nr:hypothetical protein BVY04_04895 [bacterium M21]